MVSSEYFGFPCQFSFHQMLHNRLSSGAGTVGQLVAGVPSGLSVTTPHENKAKKKLACRTKGGVKRPSRISSAAVDTVVHTATFDHGQTKSGTFAKL
jgi:hypothetical protein